jgi:hypothetical protein
MKAVEAFIAVIGGIIATVAGAIVFGGAVGIIAGAAWFTFRWFV